MKKNKSSADQSRFEFGNNWEKFSQVITDKRIQIAIDSLKEMLGVHNLSGKTFLDIGCGSGIFSLAAMKLGAKSVHSFDYDIKSVLTAQKLKKIHFNDSANWKIEQGDALDIDYLKSLGSFDFVYSWGVLHHTGSMWKALENVLVNLASGGKLFIAIYNDQGMLSKYWKLIKKLYVILPGILKWLVLIPGFIHLWLPATIRDFLFLKPFKTWNMYYENRGMSPWRDVVDWIGGYPFEVARPDEILNFYTKNGLITFKIKLCGRSLGNNQFVFIKQ